MPISATRLHELLSQAFPHACIEIIDLAHDSDHYRVRIGDVMFQGKTRIQQHQMVYMALKGRVGGEIHALSLEVYVPELLKDG